MSRMMKVVLIAALLIPVVALGQWVPVAVNTNNWMAKPIGSGFTNYWNNLGTGGVSSADRAKWDMAYTNSVSWTSSAAYNITTQDIIRWTGPTQDCRALLVHGHVTAHQFGGTPLVPDPGGEFYGLTNQNRSDWAYELETGTWFLSLKDSGSAFWIISTNIGDTSGNYWLGDATIDGLYSPLGGAAGTVSVEVHAVSQVIIAENVVAWNDIAAKTGLSQFVYDIIPTNWAEASANDNIDASSWTGTFAALCLDGVCITSWFGVIPAPTQQTGNVTLAFEYGNTPWSGLWAGQAGVIQVLAWDNAQMYGYPIFLTNIDITVENGEGLESDPSYVINNRSEFVSQTWWYAWMDIDGDGVFNYVDRAIATNGASTAGTNGLEPACLAEFNPQLITNLTNSATINFVMVDKKGGTARNGWGKTPGSGAAYPWYGVLWQDKNQTQLAATNYVYNYVVNTNRPLLWRNFWMENDWITCPFAVYASEHAGLPSLGGYGWTNSVRTTYPTDYYQIVVASTPFLAPDVFYAGIWNEEIIYGGGTPGPTYPTGSETVGGSSIVFTWTNQYLRYPTIRLQVHNASGGGGTLVYGYTNYVENTHQDGMTKHWMAPARGGPTLSSGTHSWRLRCEWGYDGAVNFPATSWSSWHDFVVP